MQVALVPRFQLDPARISPPDMKRVGDAVSKLPPPQMDHLIAQAKAADAQRAPGRQSVDFSRVPPVTRFGLDPVPDAYRPPQIPHIPLVQQPNPLPPPTQPTYQPQLWQSPGPEPGDQRSDLQKETAQYAAGGNPAHRVAEVPESDRMKMGELGDVIKQVGDAASFSKAVHFFETHTAELPEHLRHDIPAFVGLVFTSLAVIAPAVAADEASRRPVDPDAPSPTASGPTSMLGPVFDSHLVSRGAEEALNAFLKVFGNHPEFFVNTSHTASEYPSRVPANNPNGPTAGKPGEDRIEFGVKFEF